MGRYLAGVIVTLFLGLGSFQSASAQGLFESLTDIFRGSDAGTDGQQLRATIWVDPDGCEHWVMDDGLEGFIRKTGLPRGCNNQQRLQNA